MLASAESGSRLQQSGSRAWHSAATIHSMPFRVDSLLYYVHFSLLPTEHQFSIGFRYVVVAINVLEALSVRQIVFC